MPRSSCSRLGSLAGESEHDVDIVEHDPLLERSRDMDLSRHRFYTGFIMLLFICQDSFLIYLPAMSRVVADGCGWRSGNFD